MQESKMVNVLKPLLLLPVIFQELKATDTCIAWGDPHWTTFDGQDHDYQGIGKEYYYVVDCSFNRNMNTGGTPFDIKVEHEDCFGASCVGYVEVLFYSEDGSNVLDTVRLIGDPVTTTVSAKVNNAVSGSVTLPIGGNWADSIGQFGIYSYSSVDGNNNDMMFIGLEGKWKDTENEVTNGFDFKVLLSVTEASTVTRTATIEIDEYYLNQVCGLCGQYDNVDDNDIHVPSFIVTRRLRSSDESQPQTQPQTQSRALLDTIVEIITLDNTGMDNWYEVINEGSDVWQRTFTFGDAWIAGESSDTNISGIFLPNIECVDDATTLCTSVWNDDDIGNMCNVNCELNNDNDNSFIDFSSWLHGCIYDACAIADTQGMQLTELTYDEAYEMGIFDTALAACSTLCDTFTACPSECDEIPCDCHDDDNCRECQASTNHCSQCNDGYFRKTDRNHECYPCQAYAGVGCMFCQDFNGCGQCMQGYTRTQDNECGLWYCEPN